jgi:hypothetical protein
MREWDGIRMDTGATDEGAILVVNPSYFTTGELKRRMGMVGYTNQSGVAVTNFQNPMTGYFSVFATSGGSLISVAAP